ncbi:MAG: response regulator [Vallitaleaceae bacterium]|nr:response regulator [Vallitaleaceae bacterium]
MKHKYNILIVDDEEEVLSELKKSLDLEGYNVDTSFSAACALEKVKRNKYHIVLTDIIMPHMDGLELLREIKKYDPMTQMIMMTESSTMDKILNSLEYGANDYIVKPMITPEVVTNVIDYSVQKLERWRSAFVQIVQ